MKNHLKEWFVPHKGNSHTPNLFTLAGVGVSLIALAVLFTGAVIHRASLSGTSHLAEVLPSILVGLTNQSRAGGNLSTLKENELLAAAAKLKAEDMAAKGYFSHVSPDGTEPWDFIRKAGYQYRAAGENLAVHFDDSTAVNAAWLASPTHRANIENPAFTEIGIATARGVFEGRETVFVVQYFGTPKASPLPSAEEAPLSSSVEPSTVPPASASPSLDGPLAAAPPTEEPASLPTETAPEPVVSEIPAPALPESEQAPAASSAAAAGVPGPTVPAVMSPDDDGAKKPAPAPRRVSIPGRLATSPIESFGIAVFFLAAIVAASLSLVTYRHLPHGRIAHIGAGVVLLAAAATTYTMFRATAVSSGSVGEAASIVLIDGSR